MADQVSLSAFDALNERWADALVRIERAEQRERELIEAGDALAATVGCAPCDCSQGKAHEAWHNTAHGTKGEGDGD